MKYAAAICYLLGFLTMVGLQTVIPDQYAVLGYAAVFLLFVTGVYFSYSSEL
ncbi:hypothetical protein [Salinicoccus sp. RF5]|uniref:hypothetical protein n=1 Tax=Salinicoccus sp. RF5 TaxID=2748874 RepID=UPI001E51007A|nr:hypothetical protein [Salinicoccus sp. RF5]MCC4723214.1 hypothetical protein [Salinicoccus sp. RF5]